MAVDPDGRWIAAAHDRGIEVFAADSSRRVAFTPVRDARGLLFAHGQLWFIGHRWEFAGGAEPIALAASVRGPARSALRRSVDGAWVFDGSTIWNAETGAAASNARASEDEFVRLGISPDATIVLTTAMEVLSTVAPSVGTHVNDPGHTTYGIGTLALRDLASGTARTVLAIDTTPLRFVERAGWIDPMIAAPWFTDDGRHVIVAFADIVYRARTSDGAIDCVAADAGEVERLFAPGDRIGIVGSHEMTRVWDCASRRYVAELSGVATSNAAGDRLIVSDRSRLFVVDLASGKQTVLFEGEHVSTPVVDGGWMGIAQDTCLAVTPFGRAPVFESPVLHGPIRSVAWAPDNRTFAATDARGSTWLSSGGGTWLRCEQGGGTLAFVSDGRWLVDHGRRAACAWPTNEPTRSRYVSADIVAGATDDEHVIVLRNRGRRSSAARRVDLRDGSVTMQPGLYARRSAFARFETYSADGRHVLAGRDRDLIVGNTRTRAVRSRLELGAPVTHLATPDLRHVLVRTLRDVPRFVLWRPFDAVTRELVWPEGLSPAAISSRGRLAVGLDDRRAVVVELATGRELASLSLPDDEPTVAAFSHDETAVLVGTARGGVFLLAMTTRR